MSRFLEDSGVELIGLMPRQWQIATIKQCFKIINGATPKSDNPDYWNGDIVWVTPADMHNVTAINDSSRKITQAGYSSCATALVPIGSVVLSTRAPIGQVAMTAVELCTNQGCKTLIAKKSASCSFIYYLLSASTELLNILGKGTTFLELSTRDLGNFSFALPPIEEQNQIVSYLGMKCKEVDSLILLQEEMISELEAYKQTIITEAVTKGLNTDKTFKDVGIIPHHVIPQHWKMVKVLRCLSMKITDGPHETPEFFDEGIPFISAEAIKDGVIRFDLMRGRISEEYYTECCKKYTPLNNDIFMVKSGATTGNTAMLEDDIVFTIWSPLAVFRANELVLPKVLHYILQSDIFQKQIQLNWSFGTQQNIGMRVLESLLIPLIPIDEQHSIAEYLDNECSRITRLIGIKQAKINTLKKYKQSLIYECVTGKRDCRPQEERA